MTVISPSHPLLVALALTALAGGTALAQRGAPAVGKAGCKYITEAEATQALGVPSHYRSNDGGSANCVIDPVEDAKGPSVDFEVVGNTRDYNYYVKQTGMAPLSGVGDKALWLLEGQMGTLVVVKGAKCLKMTVMAPTTGTDVKTPSVAFAKKILTHM